MKITLTTGECKTAKNATWAHCGVFYGDETLHVNVNNIPCTLPLNGNGSVEIDKRCWQVSVRQIDDEEVELTID